MSEVKEQEKFNLFGTDLFGQEAFRGGRGPLAQRFEFPPFTVLSARDGEWQDRKRAWLALGIRSEIGRGGGIPAMPAADYSGRERGDGAGKPIAQSAVGTNIAISEGTAEELKERLAGMNTTSIFDPVLCELAYRWFSAPGAQILDPFAGGSVRGIVASMLGRRYHGIELRVEQVDANRAQALEICGTPPAEATAAEPTPQTDDFRPDLTPVQQVGSIYYKRDDLFKIAGVRGGKVRTCWHLAQGATGLVTAGSRQSPQVNIVAHIAQRLGIPCQVHTPEGELSPEVQSAVACGAQLVQHKAGYNSVIKARARTAAAELGWTEIPFGMECEEAITQTRAQVRNIPEGVKRILMPVGSGMSLCGVLWGLVDAGRSIPVLGVIVGADPTDRLERYAPPGWEEMVTLVKSDLDYHDPAPISEFADIKFDPIYEAKALVHLQADDLFWCVGLRETVDETPAAAPAPAPAAASDPLLPVWACGDSTEMLAAAPKADLIFTCPPYGDLERYSDDPRDISTMDYPKFMEAFGGIIQQAAKALKPDRFACFVIGDFRDPKTGLYRGFVADTIRACQAAGLHLYNDAILVTSIGSLPIRAGKQFQSGRKLGKTHQNVLVFVKGDWKKAAKAATEA